MNKNAMLNKKNVKCDNFLKLTINIYGIEWGLTRKIKTLDCVPYACFRSISTPPVLTCNIVVYNLRCNVKP